MPADRQALIAALEEYLLGEPPTLSRAEVAARSGLDPEVTRTRWEALGFTAVPEDEPAFTAADVHALEQTQVLHDLGVLDDRDEGALIRATGQSYARLAEWQLDILGRVVDVETMNLEDVGAVVARVIPVIEDLQRYVWRRHVLAVAARQLLARHGRDLEGATGDGEERLTVGFADIVGYTRRTRSLSRRELADLVETFESRAQSIVTAHGGRVVKTVGDEVLYAVEDPAAGASIALELVEAAGESGDDVAFPELRAGVAWGPVLQRLGDVFGSVVNVAARLTSVARPGRVLVDRELADTLSDDDRFALRRLRRTSVKGFRRLEPWNLRRPGDTSRDRPSAREFLEEQRDRLVRVVDEVQVGAERPAVAEGGEERLGQ